MIKAYVFKGKTYYLIQLSYQDLTGKRRQPKIRLIDGKRLSSLRQAELLERDLLNKHTKAEPGDITFDEFHEKYLNMIKYTVKNSTYHQYNGDLKKWLSSELKNMPLKDISQMVLKEFAYEYLKDQGATDNTRKRIVRTIRTILQSACEENILMKNPARKVDVEAIPKPKKVLNTNQASLLLSEARRLDHPFYHHWAFALLSGMRSGEMYSLRWTDVDLVTGNICIHSSWSNKDGYHSTKTRKSRILPISDDLKKLLLELKNLGPFSETLIGLNGSKDVFIDLVLPRNSRWRHGEQALMTRDFCQAIDITSVKFHDLRSTFITNLLAQGASLPQVMSIVGHSDVEITNGYLRLAGVDVKGVTDLLAYNLPEEMPENVVRLFKGE